MITLKCYPHPEKKDDEIYFTDLHVSDHIDEHVMQKTARIGHLSYDATGIIIPHYSSVFVKKEEMIQAGYTLVEIETEK